jgi:hypothetical protein
LFLDFRLRGKSGTDRRHGGINVFLGAPAGERNPDEVMPRIDFIGYSFPGTRGGDLLQKALRSIGKIVAFSDGIHHPLHAVAIFPE